MAKSEYESASHFEPEVSRAIQSLADTLQREGIFSSRRNGLKDMRAYKDASGEIHIDFVYGDAIIMFRRNAPQVASAIVAPVLRSASFQFLTESDPRQEGQHYRLSSSR